MYFQQILQRIASNFISTEKQYTVENIQVVAGQLGIFTEAFSTICGKFFLEIPVIQLNLGHWSFSFITAYNSFISRFSTKNSDYLMTYIDICVYIGIYIYICTYISVYVTK